MHLLDTDHMSLVARGGREGQQILRRVSLLSPGEASVSIISYEEQMRGWLAEIAAAHSVERQKARYGDLSRMLQHYCGTPIVPFDDAAVAIFQGLWLQKLRVGTMDMKIAAIALANDATLLTRNLRDFAKVPGLRAEDWSVPPGV
ncbi:MAG: type II toxin-antitoxin system VapC family toxin [Armatimonadota bacterium]|nr:type II toxin-antitoxin system VapC family toxin [Armatimonadota bacterium]